MATNGFLKTVILGTPRECKDFIRALERSERKKVAPVRMSHSVSNMSRERMRELFGMKATNK